MENIKVRGLPVISGWIFIFWGIVVSLKGFYDAFWGEPEANIYSPKKWEFISQQQWLTWSGFEITFGLACVGVAFLLFAYSKRLPEYIEREIKDKNTVL
ncbi:MAG TPA: hypothetical protein DEE98_07955 [Elusimicrobia bacterium]|nr:MAG: hypothetical protein A2278_09440 [Elusimicrobia bacterium RIFOXYA12_FULL_49_49]OGS06867.1 MAG: hypothetical protein A2204_04965 [Elusimicrobia bacterium RIFOXYA1_FULL_47_7]OGS10284.1 MAG: hypothetical protein A2386_07385 [Elusimicrobia bacterium RIFOXYB1_FULL_48_9]OGS15001.1 MAG: hypothetical protein A2251_08295 [Elusimicrobia bacterium RIFOXYA2_FULL_47_53]OGS26064.1 MAG: hypothetical protein A2339_01980 [Elusimicrobia bacterium RIFOXYB12_FULL_50_12]OGS29345.1 MAG: hypothetical protein